MARWRSKLKRVVPCSMNFSVLFGRAPGRLTSENRPLNGRRLAIANPRSRSAKRKPAARRPRVPNSRVLPRIGLGYDVHRFSEERKLILGGVEIPSNRGLLGHSDADVLLHAICDALLGAAALGDIGRHFPDTDERYRGVSSVELLKQVAHLVRSSGFEIGNIDSTLILESPKIAPYVDRMVSCVSGAAGIARESVSIKATTNEKLGSIGRSEGCAALAVALVVSRRKR